MPLYIVSTPIGNLQDITLRALDILKTVDYILCEDTRHSIILLKAHGLCTPLKSYHLFNERARMDEILKDLGEEKSIALISDAGTPVLCDPGARIVQAAHDAGHNVQVIPGASALTAAAALAGIEAPFQFIGFLPRTQGRLQRTLEEMLAYKGNSIAYESPQRLLKTLKLLHLLAPEHKVIVARELTKHFEQLHRGTPAELLAYWKERSVKGECVVIIPQ